METWDELDNEEDSEKDEERANLALMDSTFSDSESGDGSDSESKDTEHVIYKLSKSNQSTLCHSLMERRRQKARHMKTLNKQYDLLKDKLNLSKEKIEK